MHLSCRETDWEQSDEERWNNLFPNACIVLSLLNLSKESIKVYCRNSDIGEDTFLQEIPASAKSFIQVPLTLEMLLEYYKDKNGFTSNIQELYEHSVKFQLQEHNKEHQDYSSLTNISFFKKHEIAEYYAVTTVLCGCKIITTIYNDIGSSKYILADSTEENKSVFKSPLFELFKDSQYRFNQPDIADYLASYQLDKLIKDHSVQIKTLLCLFFPSSYTDEPVPALRDLIAWLCNFNKEFRQTILAKNPSIILHKYYDIPFTDEDRLTIWQWVIKHYGGLKWFDDAWIRPYCGRLACEAIIPKLKEVFTDKFFDRLSELALVIIGEGKLIGFLNEIITIINDKQANILLQSQAVHTLSQTHPEKISILEKLLNLSTEQDPDNRLFWNAFNYLWPNYISFDTLFAHLHSNKDKIKNYYGINRTFPKLFSEEERSQIIGITEQSLQKILHQLKNQKNYEYKFSRLEHYFGYFYCSLVSLLLLVLGSQQTI